MRSTLLPLSLALAAACSSPPPPAPPAPASPLDRATAGLEQARAALQEYLANAPSSGTADDQAIRRVLQIAGSTGEEINALAGRMPQGRATPRAQARPQQQSVEALMAAHQKARPWIDDVRALGPEGPSRRERALAAVRAALMGDSTPDQLAALIVLQSVGDVAYDKASFRPLVLPFAQKSVAPQIQPALYALYNTEHEPADLELVQAAWRRDPEPLRDWILHLLFLYGGGTIEGQSEEIALECLASLDGSNSGINGIWGARIGPKLEARMLELARDPNPETRRAAIYFGLSTFQDKSQAVVDELIKVLADPDFNNYDRALWGLGHGVPDPQKPRVVTALVDLYKSRSDPSIRQSCERIVVAYGGEEARAKLAH